MYGNKLPHSVYFPSRSVVGVDQSPSGNLILRVGRENTDNTGWHQTEHVVMEPDEAREFVAEIQSTLGLTD